MKFTDGNWLLQPDVTAFYPAEARSRTLAPHAFTVYATKRINHRGDTLAGPLLTVECSAPMPDIIRVKMTHFAGTQPHGPTFVADDVISTDARVDADEHATTLTSGKLSVRIPHGEPWQVDFVADGKPITSSGRRGMGIIERADGSHFMHEQLNLGVGEQVYGLGERFTAFVKNGQVVETWNKDGGTSSEQ
ncbi:MAG TPA: hypothetical protein VFT66_13570, partial [Roseiflexaceae bacterium]|nr:hypothetical protein [Roseiflexaceae bacterium]